MKPNTLHQRNRRAKMYAKWLTSEGNPSKTVRPMKEVITARTDIELRWERERAAMQLKPTVS